MLTQYALYYVDILSKRRLHLFIIIKILSVGISDMFTHYDRYLTREVIYLDYIIVTILDMHIIHELIHIPLIRFIERCIFSFRANSISGSAITV